MIQKEINEIKIDAQNNQNLYSNIATQNQLQKFYLWRRDELINPFQVQNLHEHINFQKEFSIEKTDKKKVFILLIENQSLLHILDNFNIASYEFDKILQPYTKQGQIIQLTHNGKIVEFVNNKKIEEIWPNEQNIELIAIYKEIPKKQIFLILQDRYKIILNESFNTKDNILNDHLKNKFNGQQFFLYYENRVINQDDTFESLFPNKECCKLYVVYPKLIQSVEGEMNLSLLQYGEIIKTVSIKPQQQIYPKIKEYTKEECVAYKLGQVIPSTAKFSIAFKGQKDVCIIIQPKLQYLQECLRAYENIVDSIKSKIKREEEKRQKENLSYQNPQINQQNSYYFYFQHNNLFKHHILEDFEKDIEQYFQSNTQQYTEYMNQSLTYPAFEEKKDDELIVLASNQSCKQQKFAQSKTKENTEKLNKNCEKCKKTLQKTEIFTFYCDHSYHINCLFDKVIEKLLDRFQEKNINKEITFSCIQGCEEIHNLRNFQDHFNQQQQHQIQNLFVRYFAHQAIDKNKRIMICDRCQFAYFIDYSAQTEYPVCQCQK